MAGAVTGFAAGGGFSGGGGGGGGFTGTSGFTNPSLGFLANLFGSVLGSRGKGRIFPGGDFGIFEGADEQIQDFLFNPVGLFPGEQSFLESLLGDQGDLQGRLGQAEGVFDQIQPFALEAAETGFRTDAAPVFDEAIRRLQRDVLPQIAETVGGRSGIRSFGVADAGARAGADLLGQASLADIALAESAAGRRLQGIPLSGQIAGTQLALPFAFGQDILSLGGGARNVIEEGRGRPLAGLTTLSGLGQNQQFLQQGFNPTSSTGQLTGTLASFFPGGIGSLFPDIGAF